MSLPARMGRYEIVSRLASGGMAEILLARVRGAEGFHRPVVLKRVLPHLADSSELRAMFIDEARIIAGLHHPNVVQVHELAEEGGELFLVMEYLAGESASGLMRRLARRQRPLPLALAAHVISEACAGLHAAHSLLDGQGRPRHVVHRDVSPQNLFVTYQGDVAVLDFGVAKARARLARTHTGHAKGKFGYMSPEQCRREELDARTDVFALGVVLHELITGRRLFPEQSELAMVRAICDEPVPPPSSIRTDCPASLDAVCLRALEKEPIDRWDTADDMRRALIRVVRAVDAELVPRDGLRDLMVELFPDHIAEKQGILRDVETGDGPPALAADPVGSTLPAPRRSFGWLGLLGLVLIAGGIVLGIASSRGGDPEAGPGPSAPLAGTAGESRDPTPRAEPEPGEVAVVILRSTPPARATVGDDPIGETPVRIHLRRGDRPVIVTLRREGYATEVRHVTPDVSEQRLEVQLSRDAVDGISPGAEEAERPRPSARGRDRRGHVSTAMEGTAERDFYLFD